MTLVSGLLIVLTIMVSIPIVTFALQCFLSFLPRVKSSFDPDKLPRLAVLIPSHNEEAIVSGILQDTLSQAKEGDRVIVIADNCTDGTADVARSHGAEVIERTDLENRGKAYALAYALDQLAADPPEVIIIVDADCRISADALAHLSGKAAELDRAVQGSYIFGDQENMAVSNLASSFTLWFKNHIRPLGSIRAGMPCQLTGSGMAIPWHAIRKINVANKELAEDTTIGIHLALQGHPPTFCPEARIDGHVPKEWGTMVQQRRRWEQGYLQSIWHNAFTVIGKSITSFKPHLLWVALDLCIPPLALLGIAWGGLIVLAVIVAALGGSTFPLSLLVFGAVLMALSLAGGWFVHCRDQVPAKAILALPWFLVRKIGIYASLILKKEKVWLRTERD